MSENQFVHKDIIGEPIEELSIKNIDEKYMKSALLKRTVGTALVSALVTFLFIAFAAAYIFMSFYKPGLATGTNSLGFANDEATKKSLDKLKIVISNIKDNYVEKLTDTQIIEAIVESFPSALNNPYTYYMSAEEYKSNTETMSGQYAGIGCTVSYTEDTGVVIVEVMTDSPAQKAGVMQGDILLSIDGETIKDVKDTYEVASKVKGVEGTTVKIEVFRPSSKTKFTYEIVRKTILYKNVNHKMLSSDIGYLQVKTFAENVDNDFIAAMDDLQAKGAKNVVFDLRYNSGGNAQIMIDMLEYLLPEKTILSTIKGREDGKDFEYEWITKSKMMVPATMKYTILTNEYTASASELFSGCLRDHDKAKLVGKKTFGKGSGTRLYSLSDGSAVNITIFKYYLPKGESIEGVGIKPDVEIDLTEELKSKPIEKLTLDEDVQLQKAIELLK